MEEMWNIMWNKLIDLSSRTWGENEGNRDLKWPIMLGASQWLRGKKKIKIKKKSAYNVGDPGSIPGSEIYPGEGSGNPLKYFCVKNSIDRRAWRAAV